MIKKIVILIVSLATFACSSSDTIMDKAPRMAGVDGRYVYRVDIVDGLVFIVLIGDKSASPIGPFKKISERSYTCELEGQGLRQLTRDKSGNWFYGWSLVHRQPLLVDGRKLEGEK